MKNKSIIYIAGVARSGTSWLGQILNSSPDINFKFQPLFSYELKNRVNEDSTADDFESFFYDMSKLNSDFLNQTNRLENNEYPAFEKKQEFSHLVFKENRYQNIIEPILRKNNNVKLLGIIRNPNACLNSWFKLPSEFPINSDPLKEWRYGDCKNNGHEDFFGYYKWKEVSNLYLDLKDKWPNRVYIIKYEELASNTLESVKDIFNFFNITFTEQTLRFIIDSKEKNNESPYSVFKNKDNLNSWINEIDKYITNEILNDLTGTRLEQFLI